MKFGFKSRLEFISLLPIIILFLLSSYTLYNSYETYNTAQNLQTHLEYDESANALANELSNERGLSSIYIASSGQMVGQNLAAQRQKVDKALQKMQSIKNASGSLKTNPKVDAMLKTLAQQRADVDALKVSFNQLFYGFYTNLINELFVDIKNLNNSSVNERFTALSNIYTSLVVAKEYSGLERGYISNILTRYTALNDDELKKWFEYIGGSDSYITDYAELAGVSIQLNSILKSKSTNALQTQIDDARSNIMHSINDGFYSVDPTEWFRMHSMKIDTIAKAEEVVASAMKNELSTIKAYNLYILIGSAMIWALAVILAVIGYLFTRDITRNIKSLQEIFQTATKRSDYLDLEKDIDLDNTEGTKSAYQLLEYLLEESYKKKEMAEDASQSKSLFLANMSHEIRTPLNGIVGFTELLKNTNLDEEQKEFIQIIEKSSENLLSIINNILDLSKIESNSIEIENITFNAREEFENAVEVYAVKSAEKNINLGFYMDPDIENPIKGDPTKIKEVLINLISNAIKFTNANGEIDVEIRKKPSNGENKTKIEFSVKDNGIGMTPDQQEKVFEAFGQADSSITRKYGGTGLGLTISKQYVEKMGGQLKLDSEQGKGTRFFFTLEFDELPTVAQKVTNYADIKFARLASGKHKPQDDYVGRYLQYYGAKYQTFNTMNELKSLKEEGVRTILIDLEHTDEDALKEFQKTGLDIIVIAKATKQGKFDNSIAIKKTIYEPVNVTKIGAALEALSTKDEQEEELPQKSLNNIRFNAKALVAEDNSINQKLIKRTLEELGMQVDLASNGLEAFEKRRANDDYDVVFMDIQMPVMDGVEATHEILDYEEDEELRHIPIVALTANALKGDRERFLNEGLDEYTIKPLVINEIVSILERLIGNKAVLIEDDLFDEAEEQPAQEQHQNHDVDEVAFELNLDDEEIETVEEKTTQEPIPSDDSTEESDDDMTDIDDLEAEEAQIERNDDKILVLKSNSLEARMFDKVITKLGYNVEVAENFDEMMQKTSDLGNPYQLVMVDRNVDAFDLSDIERLNKVSPVVLLVHSKYEPSDAEERAVSEVVKNFINKELLKIVIQKNSRG